MTRCLNCDAILRSSESTCYACGAVQPPIRPEPNFNDRFAKVINGILGFSILLTVASLFTNYAPPFSSCAGASVILTLVSKTASRMAEK